MSDTLARKDRRYKARPRGAGIVAYQQAAGCRSPEAAHSKMRRVAREFFGMVAVLRVQGETQQIGRLFEEFSELLELGDAPDLVMALLQGGDANRSQDEIREACLAGDTTEHELKLLVSRTHQDIGRDLALLRAARRMLAEGRAS